ncbi:MAG: hypothetical protein QM527_05560 [Alphaproteobacteria bacterium]|nr:hypothetical protein [Alphaproteobacteria bacterium]
MNKVLYCDFTQEDPHGIYPEVRRFLNTLQSLTEWGLLEVKKGQVWLNDQALGPAPEQGSWLDCLNCALETAQPDLVFIWFNDLIPTRWSPDKVMRMFAEAERLMCDQALGPQYIRLNAYPPALGIAHGMRLRSIEKQEAYQCSLPASIWHKDYLSQMLFGLSSVWTLETQMHHGRALCVHSSLLSARNMMLRGRPNVAFFWWLNRPCAYTTHDCVYSLAWCLKFYISRFLQVVSPHFYHWLYRKHLR